MLAVATGAYVAAVYLAGDGARAGEGDLAAAFRTRALIAGVGTGAIAFAALAVVASTPGAVGDRLLEWPALAAVAVSALAGLSTLELVRRSRFEAARYGASAAVAVVVVGWALAQRPELLPGLTVEEAAAERSTLIVTVVGVLAGLAIVVPSLALLFGLVLRGRFDKEGREADVGVGVGVGEPSGRRSRISPFRVALFLVAAGVPLTLVFDGGPLLAAGVLALLTFVALASLSLGAAAAANDEPSESRR